ncbi:septum formation initiator family protein [Paenibacillus thermotolerans]|uniref:septum formation initiator family protein n=1 Tax=Paenibacillus thermotolerans TaxID=3027807 RepID=UPI002367DC2A|nr:MULTISPECIES: septum formation initiator family protein [unclassified Paenibacillus]
MPAYIDGSLALDERRSNTAAPAVKTKAKPAAKKAQKVKSLTAPEKLLYLFGVVAFSLIAGIVIWRYAMIFEMNTRIVQMETEIRKLEKENTALKNEVAKLQDPQRLIDTGIQLGLVLPDEIAPPKAGDQAVASIAQD